MQTLPYVDPLIPLDENTPNKLGRLSSNISTLTSLIEDAERRNHTYLTAMFARSRQRKVDEAHSCMSATSLEA